MTARSLTLPALRPPDVAGPSFYPSPAGGTWTTEADAFAVAATVHCLLHNEYMQVETVTDAATGAPSAAPKLPLKVC
jgi:hypothetical protein